MRKCFGMGKPRSGAEVRTLILLLSVALAAGSSGLHLGFGHLAGLIPYALLLLLLLAALVRPVATQFALVPESRVL